MSPTDPPMRAPVPVWPTHRFVYGVCSLCNSVNKMSITLHQDTAIWTDLRGQFVCEGCGFNNRTRLLLGAIELETEVRDVLVFEKITNLFKRIDSVFDEVRGCEFFGQDFEPGQFVDFRGMQIEHQDMMDLSYHDGQFDLVVHSDVLEHVPDFVLGLSECHRVLKPGGKLIFACPIYCQEAHERVAEMTKDGLRFFGKPSFHGNPLSEAGSPVFTKHGLAILDDLRGLGFEDVQFGIEYSPLHGIVSNGNPFSVGLMWPLVVRASKNS